MKQQLLKAGAEKYYLNSNANGTGNYGPEGFNRREIQELFAENAEHTLCTPCVFLCDLCGKNNFYDFADD